MTRSLVTLVAGSAMYGFAAGSVHSPTYALRNLVKFPLLVLLTAALCALAYRASALLVTRRLAASAVAAVSLRTFADLALLLGSLAPVTYFLALTIEQPSGDALHEYPLFVGTGVVFISVAGTMVLVRQAAGLVRQHGLGRRAAVTVVVTWLAISLVVGGQCAWWMRPFFGVSTIPAGDFMDGTKPDHHGATSFYEAVWDLVSPAETPPRVTPR